eukprot:TCONS_00052540-protein
MTSSKQIMVFGRASVTCCVFYCLIVVNLFSVNTNAQQYNLADIAKDFELSISDSMDIVCDLHCQNRKKLEERLRLLKGQQIKDDSTHLLDDLKKRNALLKIRNYFQ